LKGTTPRLSFWFENSSRPLIEEKAFGRKKAQKAQKAEFVVRHFLLKAKSFSLKTSPRKA
jgi:hypothetical protein